MEDNLSILKPEEQAILKMRHLYERHGYQKYKMGRFEEYSFYMENKSFLTSQNILTFTDLDGKLLALKPDVTLSIIKNTKATANNTEKLYYIENVYRPSKESHTYKEINQVGLECIGHVDQFAVLEILKLAVESLAFIGPEFLLEINHMGFVGGLLNALDADIHTKEALLHSLRAKNIHELKATALQANIAPAYLNKLCGLVLLGGDFEVTLRQAGALVINSEMDSALKELSAFYEAAKKLGFGDKLRLDFSIINDMQYYNGILFAGYLEGLPRPVLAGGRYDSMMQKIGKNVGAVGFALYLDELNRLPSPPKKCDVDAVVLYKEADDFVALSQAVDFLRAQGLKVRTELNLPQELKYGALYTYRNGKLEVEPC